MKINFIGHACLLLEWEDYKIIIDPFITGNPNVNLRVSDIQVDAVLITHGHSDHIGDAVEIAQNNKCVVVGIVELCMYFAELGIPVHGLSIGGAKEFDWGRVKMTQALHGIGAELDSKPRFCMPAGFVITMGDKTIYHAGDTGIFQDMKLIGEMNSLDVAALPIGGNYTMDPEDSIEAAKLLQAKSYIPIHYNTFDLIKQDEKVWEQRMNAHGFRTFVLQNGGSVVI